MMRFLSFVLFIAGVSALLGAAWWVTHAEAATAEEAPRRPFVLSVTLGEVRRADVRPRVTLTAAVRSARQAELAFLVPGKLATLSTGEGEQVVAGDELARLADADQAVALQLAEAGERRALRELERLLAGARDEEIRRLEAELTVAEAEVAVARKQVERGKQLVQDAFISASEFDVLVAERDAAEGRLRAAMELLAAAREGAREEEIAVQRAEVDLQRAQVDLARTELEKTILRAPFDGHVVRRFVDQGEILGAGEPVFELVDLDHLEVVLDVPARFAGQLAPGARVTVRPEQDGPAFETELAALVVAADEDSRNFRGIVRVESVDDTERVLRPGTFARATVYLAPIRDALVLPADALRTLRDGTVIVRAVPGEPADDGADNAGGGLTAEWIPVRLLGLDPDGAAVEPLEAGSLAPGDRVVVTGVDLAFPGASLAPRARAEDGRSADAGSEEPVE